MRPSLVERAKKRRVRPDKESGWFIVEGNPTLGDHYADYRVHQRDDGTFYCTCQGSRGGEYRQVCSHVTGVMLYEQDHPKSSEPSEPEPEPEPEEDRENETKNLATIPEPDSIEDYEDVDPEALQPVDPDPEPVDPPPTRDLPPDDLLDIEQYLDPDEPLLPSSLRIIEKEPEMPEKFSEFRPAQWKAITEVTEALDSGFKVVMVSAPTGAGKTIVAESVRRLQGIPAIYTCTTKTLQDQILRDFEDYAKVIKGRANYPTLENPDATADDCTMAAETLPACVNCPGFNKGSSWGNAQDGNLDDDGHNPYEVEGEEMTVMHCAWCHPIMNCPYQVARGAAQDARLAVLNTSYFLTETNKSRGLFANWSLVLIDEADKLEEELMRFVEVTIGPYQRRDLGIGLPKKKTVDQAWVDWIHEEVIPAIKSKRASIVVQRTLSGTPDLKALKERRRYDRMLQEVSSLITLEEDEDGEVKPMLQQGWVYTGYEGKEDKYVTVTFKPVMVNEYAQRYLWNKAGQFVLLSATLISAEQMASDLGLEEGEWTVVEVPSSFPVERRPIIPTALVSVTHKTKDEAYPVLVEQIDEIMEAHPDERMLVHSVSYDLTNYLTRNLSGYGRLHTYGSSKEREGALNRFLADENGVMVAPSFDRGVDLHGDDCRVIVVAKIPWPYLGDAQVKKRTYSTGRSGQIWYAVQTIRTICQMTGRGMRSEEDWCKTYILDKEFTRLYGQNRRLFPEWWKSAIVWDENDPRWRDVLAELGKWEN